MHLLTLCQNNIVTRTAFIYLPPLDNCHYGQTTVGYLNPKNTVLRLNGKTYERTWNKDVPSGQKPTADKLRLVVRS